MEKKLHYPVVQKPEQISANFDGSKEKYYLHINSMFSSLKSLANSEGSAQESTSTQIVDSLTSLQNEINGLKARRNNNQNKYVDVDISETQENFMDYDYNSSGSINPNFEPKSLWSWQWKELQNSEFLIKKEIK